MKVLVIKIAAIGDFLMATPALRALKLHGSVNSVTLLAGHSIAAVVQDNPHLDKIYYLDDARIFKGSFLGQAVGSAEDILASAPREIRPGLQFPP